ncbi:MAG TPA: hypothetical protein VIC83_02045 [Candidatus Limnocylindria bacterium]|jgi:hypothetical protein
MAPPARRASPVRWGEPPPGLVPRAVARIRRLFGRPPPPSARTLPELPVALRRSELAVPYLAAEAASDHPAAGQAATVAMESSAAVAEWWPADIWGHRALWHFERASMELEATRAARMIGDLRSAAGDPLSARRYYAEAISEARDLGAEREQGLAALGMGRAEMDLADVTTARRLAQIAEELLERAGAPPDEIAAARELRGQEKEVS